MGKRSRLEMYYDVLEAITRGTHKPTRIMYKTLLSWNMLREILEPLIDNGFIRTEEQDNSKRRYYVITDKGKESLSYYKQSIEGLMQTS
jgi:predicted transcriptional regulator